MQTFKEGIKKLSGSIETRLSRFLFAYRTTPQSSPIRVAPAFLTFGRSPRARLDLLFPNVDADVSKSQDRMMSKRKNRKIRSFMTGDLVYYRNFPSNKPRWLPAVIQTRLAPLSYRLSLPDGRGIRRHIDHLIPREPDSITQTSSSDDISS